jgi:hypothetical protein
MVEKTKIVYVAEDGTEFNKKQECIEYEHKISHYAELWEALKEVRKICQNHNCNNCPFAPYGECFATDSEYFDNEELGRYVEPSAWTF